MDNLALEILGEIFVFASGDILYKDGRKQLLDISRVCKVWRDTVFLTNRLWNSLGLEYEITPTLMERAEKWLARAGTLPKHLSIRAADYDGVECEGTFAYRRRESGNGSDDTICSLGTHALADFLTTGPIIHKLSIFCCDSQCLRNLVTAIAIAKGHHGSRGPRQWSWDSLLSLHLEIVGTWSEWGPLEKERPERSDLIFRHLPHVASFNLILPSYDRYQSDSPFLYLPTELLAHLTRFTLQCGWPGNAALFVNALKSCKNVESLTIDMDLCIFDINPDDPWDGDPYHWKPVLLPKLRSLHLQNIDRSGLEILRYFRSPMIEELDMYFNCLDYIDGLEDGSFGSQSHRNIVEFIKNSEGTPSLRYLRLCCFAISGRGLLRVLSKLPSLTHLVLDSVTIGGSIFRRLKKRQQMPLPKLRTLELLGVTPDLNASRVMNYLKAYHGWS
ncbi:hypothetical protein NMY22_g1362 [Coprinellus aureogranulatus]|nr:hypothetical protein NMY22_g1362 [Coprinellus aureogranulatus]